MDKIFQVKQKTVKGLIALIARTGLLQVIAVVATFVLTVFLDPAQFGVFAIVAAAVDILVYFSDIGLAGALIQKQEVTDDDLATTFTIQQILSLVLLGLGFVAEQLYRSCLFSFHGWNLVISGIIGFGVFVRFKDNSQRFTGKKTGFY